MISDFEIRENKHDRAIFEVALCQFAIRNPNSEIASLAWLPLLAPCYRVQAQQPAGTPRIGILIASSASFNRARVEALRQRLRELGYVEGKNIFIEYRNADGKPERLPDLAAELVQLKVDVIVASAGNVAVAAKKASAATMPIVFGVSSDPVGSGLVSSLARPRWKHHRT